MEWSSIWSVWTDRGNEFLVYPEATGSEVEECAVCGKESTSGYSVFAVGEGDSQTAYGFVCSRECVEKCSHVSEEQGAA